MTAATVTMSLNKGRNRNPGETRGHVADPVHCGTTLNKGRNRNPGETRREPVDDHRSAVRSTKAGIGIPAKHEPGQESEITIRPAQQRQE